MQKTFIGSNFDDFLREEGTLEETERVAIKRILAMDIANLMQEQKINKVKMAKMMATSRSALDRLLDPTNDSVTLTTLERAAHVLGKELRLSLV